MMVESSKQKAYRTDTEMIVPSFGFAGEIASGKSTYADHLKAILDVELGIYVHRLSFSSKIGRIGRNLFRMKDKDRVLLGEICSKLREIDPQVWAKYLVRDIKADGEVPFIVDGLRFQHDLEVLRQNFEDFCLVRINTDEKQRMEAYKKLYGGYPTDEELNNKGEGGHDKIAFRPRAI